MLLYTKLLREKHRYAFQQTQDLADVGLNIAQSDGSKTFKQSWKRIKAEKT
ncbi:hypothetical protein [Vibrio gangliei]|uniref:hypothetical protein n=1 Tax=Vibrio gangliei TaxID=2077090 RepID=UPI0014728BD7|nr:hypothetical protein [Vibrio gangliei]